MILEMWPILLGWPAVLVSLALSVLGIVRSKPVWLVVSAVAVLPISLYLAGTPRFSWVGLILPVLLFAASFAVRRSLLWLAWSCVAPVAGFFLWLGVIILTE